MGKAVSQSLTQLPKTTKFEICGVPIEIQDHKLVFGGSLFDRIISITDDPDSNRDTLVKFEEYGVTFEAAIECCARDLEEKTCSLRHHISWHYDVVKNRKIYTNENWNRNL